MYPLPPPLPSGVSLIIENNTMLKRLGSLYRPSNLWNHQTIGFGLKWTEKNLLRFGSQTLTFTQKLQKEENTTLISD